MGLFHLAELFGMTIRESANDGSDFTNPSADYRRLFLGEDGLLHVKDSAGTVTDPFTGGGSVATDAIWDAKGDLAAATGANTAQKLTVGGTNGMSLRVDSAATTGLRWANQGFDFQHYTGGDIALTSTSMAAESGPTHLVVAAAASDLLMVSVSCTAVTTTAASISFDFATMVGGSPVNYIGTRSGTPQNISVQHWFIPQSILTGCGGEYPYVVQSGDISGGNVTLRLYARVSANRSVNADASNPLDTWVRNTGH